MKSDETICARELRAVAVALRSWLDVDALAERGSQAAPERGGMRWPALLGALLVLVGLGCGGEARAPSPSEVAVDPWVLLRAGDLDGAERVFELWREDAERRPLAVGGQLRIASLTRDRDRIDQLLASIPQGAPFAITMLAAAAAMVDGELTARERDIVAAACPPPPEAAAKPVVQTICAQAALFEGRDAIMACRAGCDGRQTTPIFSAGAIPVVEMHVAGIAEPASFILDTGAATSTLMSAFVKKHGLTPLRGTMHPIGTSGGPVSSMFVLAPVRLGDRVVEDVRFAVVDVAVAGVAGILSPHDVFRDSRVTLDLQRRELSLGPGVAAPPESMAGFPLLYQARRPHLLVSVDGREPRPMAIDTGADRTRLQNELEEMGAPWPRAGETGSSSAGGVVKVGKVAGTLSATAGPIRMDLVSPFVFPKRRVVAPFDLGSFGLLGLDVVEGRVIAFDLPHRRIDLSADASLRPWPVGAKQELVASGRDFGDDIVITEEVTGREGTRVLLDVRWSSGEATEHLRIAIEDGEAARKTWLVTRPIERAWSLTQGAPQALSVGRARERLAKVITVFQPRAQGAFDTVRYDDETCGRLSIPSALGGKAALARIVSCPYGPWRVRAVVLEQEGEIVWRLDQRSASDGS